MPRRITYVATVTAHLGDEAMDRPPTHDDVRTLSDNIDDAVNEAIGRIEEEGGEIVDVSVTPVVWHGTTVALTATIRHRSA